MAKKTTYQIVYPDKIAKKFTVPFKSINAIHKFLLENKGVVKKENGSIERIGITTAWFEEDTSRPKDTFNPFQLGYRDFSLENDDSVSYSRFPMHEY